MTSEWGVETPYSGEILPLAGFQLAKLSYCSAVINGVSGTINNGKWLNDEITMTSSSGVVEAQPSVLSKDGASFQVTWKTE